MIRRTSKWQWHPFLFLIFAFLVLADGRSGFAETSKKPGPDPQSDACVPATGGRPRAVTIEDYVCLKQVSGARISKNGRHVAYVEDSDINVISVGSPETGPVSEGFGWSPVWSHDDQAVYFLSDSSGRTQLSRNAITGNREPTALACIGQEVGVLKLSPDERHLLLELSGKEKIKAEELLLGRDCALLEAKKEESRAESEPIEIKGMTFKEDGKGYSTAESKDRIYAVDFVASKLTQLTTDEVSSKGANHDTEATWSPDGARIAFIREYPSTLEYHSEVWTAFATGNGVPTRLTPWPRAVRRSPSWSKDGKLIAYLWSDALHGPFANPQLAIYSLRDGRERLLTTKLDRPVMSFQFSADSKFIYFIYADEGAQHLARVSLRDERIQDLIKGAQVVDEADANPTGRLAIIMQTENDPPNLYAMDPEKSLKPLRAANDGYLAGLKRAERKKIIIDIPGGLRMDLFITKPTNFDSTKKYPTVLNLHGGPIDEQHSYGYHWFSQFLAANGYLVVEPNPPGSLGQGQSEVRQIYRNWGCTDYPDALLAVDYVIAMGLADPQKLAVTGYSYGGYLTNCIITRTPKKFKAAVSGAGHSLIMANFGPDKWLGWYMWELGAPWQNREAYEKLSPLYGAGYVETPTLFLSGDNDWNVPILNSELFYQSLRVKGVETELVVYPGVGHGGWGEEWDKDYYARILSWFDRHLKP
jgi:dipeptidyl aminopeptidase/acylaminoacyl peptidase